MVFQVKWGKMDQVLAGMAQMRTITEPMGAWGVRVFTDLAGPMFTLVQEMEVESLDQWQQRRGELFANPAFRAMTAHA
jgi:hypothetical protein